MADIEEGAAPDSGEPETWREAVTTAFEADKPRQVVEDYYDTKAAVAVEEIDPTLRETLEAARKIDPDYEPDDATLAARQEAERAAGPADGIPEHFSGPERAALAKLEPADREAVLGRVKAMEAAHTQRSQELAPWRQVKDTYAEYLQQIGLTDEASVAQGVNNLVEVERALRTGTPEVKLDVLRRIAIDYGILAPGDPNGQQQAAPPQQQQQAQAQQYEAERIVQDIEAFRAETNPDGKPKYPFFDMVRPDMARLAMADTALGETPTLTNLYERAIYGNEHVRAQMEAIKRQEWREEHNAAEAERVKQARRAGGSISGSGGNAVAAEPETWREAIVKAAQMHGAA